MPAAHEPPGALSGQLETKNVRRGRGRVDLAFARVQVGVHEGRGDQAAATGREGGAVGSGHGAGGAPHAAQVLPRGQELAPARPRGPVPGPTGAPWHAAACRPRAPEGLHARRAMPPLAHVAGKRPPLCPGGTDTLSGKRRAITPTAATARSRPSIAMDVTAVMKLLTAFYCDHRGSWIWQTCSCATLSMRRTVICTKCCDTLRTLSTACCLS